MRYIAIFFNSYAGMYVTQSFFHALVAALIGNRAMKAWKIYDPVTRQRFRLIVILFPIVSFPFYQLIDSARSGPQFRMESLFDANRWLLLEIGGLFPVGLLFLAVLAGTALVFLFQEMVPVLTHTFRSAGLETEGTPRARDTFIEETARALSIESPRILIIDDDEKLLFSTTGRQAVVYVSAGLIGVLTGEQLQVALAHELAHIARNRRPFLIAVFALRVLMFFNPVVLIKYRLAVRDEEKICDDMAVSLTRNPDALAAALEKFYHEPAPVPGLDRQNLPDFTSSLEERSHNLHLGSRISRLRRQSVERGGKGTPALAVSLAVIGILCYFIV